MEDRTINALAGGEPDPAGRELTVDDLVSTSMSAEQLAAARALDVLTDEQRQEVFYFYCQDCGRKQFREPADAHGCNCMKDE